MKATLYLILHNQAHNLLIFVFFLATRYISQIAGQRETENLVLKHLLSHWDTPFPNFTQFSRYWVLSGEFQRRAWQNKNIFSILYFKANRTNFTVNYSIFFRCEFSIQFCPYFSTSPHIYIYVYILHES